MTIERILIVDDDPQIQTMLRISLQSAGYETSPALTWHDAIRLAASAAPDAILLDLGLPDRDGKDVLRDIRAFSQVPIIILSARDREAEKVAALDLGVDDYLEKPFGISELQARLRTAARHTSRSKGEMTRVEVGDLVIDLDRHLVLRAGEALRLTPKEYASWPSWPATPVGSSPTARSSRRSGGLRITTTRSICVSSSDNCVPRSNRIPPTPRSSGQSQGRGIAC